MDKKSRQFFTALNTFSNGKIDVININRLTLEEILEKYTKYAQVYLKFIESEKGTENAKKSEFQKREYDKMFRYWINPFHIALRNEIGRIGLPKPQVEQITKDKGDKARLTQATIDKIKGKYIETLEKKTYMINPQKAREEILKILEEIKKSQSEIEHQNIEQEDEIYQMPIEEIDKYTFETGVANNLKSYIKKYRLALEDDGVMHSIEIYGDLDLNRFYRDGMYRRVVLEAIEDLELENYSKGQSNNNKRNIGYIGNFRNIRRDEEEIWQQEIKESDLDAIQKIDRLHEKYKIIASQRNNYFKLGEDR